MELDFKKHTVYTSDPFAVEPLPKAHYFPSPEKRLETNQRKTAISPTRKLEEHAVGRQDGQSYLSPMDECFLKGTNHLQYDTGSFHLDKPEVDFDESWPTSEKPSSLSLTGIEDEGPVEFARYQSTLERFAGLKQAFTFLEGNQADKPAQKRTDPVKSATSSKQMQDKSRQSRIPTKGGTGATMTKSKFGPAAAKPTKTEPVEGSILSKYVERFRHSAPMSREERERKQAGNQSDFWWLSEQGTSGNHDNTPVNQSAPPQPPSSNDVIPLTEGQEELPASPDTKRTRELQRKADRLLEQSTSTVVSTDPAVSTEGLGSNMSDMSSMDEYAHRPKFAAYLGKDDQHRSNPYGTSRVPNMRPQPVSQPENDPLQQWRLRRRMEQAQQGATTHAETFNFISKTEKQKQIEAKLEEFKRKLAGKESHPSSTALPQRPSQSIHRSSSYQFTPSPGIDKQTAVTNSSGHHGRSSSEPQIASPLLRKQKPLRDRAEVDPHLHLMCDLLPCPHQESYKEVFNDRGLKSVHIEDCSVTEEPTKGDNKQSPRQENSNESIYKQFLEAEKPDIDKTSKDYGLRGKYEGIDKSVMRNDVKEKTEAIVSDRMDIESKQKNDTNKVRRGDNDQDIEKSKSVDMKTGYDDSAVCDRGNVTKGKHKQERDTRERVSDSESDPELRHLSRKDRLPKPTGSSSPKLERRNLDKAIGQVVKNHLFSMSTSTVLSSVESIPPSASTDRLPQKPVKAEISVVNEMDEYEDSDDEFRDDHLLQMLRSQRLAYEQQLNDIDEQISRLESR